MKRGILALAHHTGWSLSEIDDLPMDDFIEWLELIPTQQ